MAAPVSEPPPAPESVPAGPVDVVEGASSTASRRRTWLVLGSIALGLVAVLALVWGLGGFARRTDLLQPTPAGTPITVGPYQLRFSGVTAQRTTSFDGKVSWTLSAVGTGRTTGNESLAPSYSGDDGTFVSKDVRSGEIEVPTGVRYGAARSFVDGAHFTPGLPPEPIVVDFSYRAGYVPGRTLRFVVFQLRYADTSLIGNQKPTWSATNRGYDFRLPVRVLPPVR